MFPLFWILLLITLLYLYSLTMRISENFESNSKYDNQYRLSDNILENTKEGSKPYYVVSGLTGQSSQPGQIILTPDKGAHTGAGTVTLTIAASSAGTPASAHFDMNGISGTISYAKRKKGYITIAFNGASNQSPIYFDRTEGAAGGAGGANNSVGTVRYRNSDIGSVTSSTISLISHNEALKLLPYILCGILVANRR